MRSIWYMGPKRVRTRSSRSLRTRAITFSSASPKAAATSANGRSTRGNPPCRPFTMALSRSSMRRARRFRRPARAVAARHVARAALLEAAPAEEDLVGVPHEVEPRVHRGDLAEYPGPVAPVDHAVEVIAPRGKAALAPVAQAHFRPACDARAHRTRLRVGHVPHHHRVGAESQGPVADDHPEPV